MKKSPVAVTHAGHATLQILRPCGTHNRVFLLVAQLRLITIANVLKAILEFVALPGGRRSLLLPGRKFRCVALSYNIQATSQITNVLGLLYALPFNVTKSTFVTISNTFQTVTQVFDLSRACHHCPLWCSQSLRVAGDISVVAVLKILRLESF